MLNRQKTLLYLLKVADRPVLKTELTKWSFLLRNETHSGGGSAFYDFVPYKFGPFSFCLYQEFGKLEANAFLLSVGDKKWRIDEQVDFKSPEPQVRSDAEWIIDKFSERNLNSLIDYVYDKYPLYTYNSTIKKLATAPVAAPAVYTAGYEGLSVDSFLNLLVQKGVRRIIDVRHNPIARRFGFHKSTLTRLAGNLGIEYVHFPNLGIVGEQRKELKTQQDRDNLFDQYKKTTLKQEKSAIGEVCSLVESKPSVMICMEAEPCTCHRSHLASLVSKKVNLPVVHLSED